MSYGKFAYLYDQLMEDVPYDSWVELISQKAGKYGVRGKKLLDLACGTGQLAIRLGKQGYDVTGVDLSVNMLAVAQAKAEQSGLRIPFYQQNMAELGGFGEFDVIGIFCDSLNYLETESEVQETFQRVHRHLKDNGLFIFDVHSIYKMMQIFMNQTFAENDEEISYIWHSYQGGYPNSVEHDLSFFVLDEATGRYDRYDELHFQRTYPVETYVGWLRECGFELLEVSADFEDAAPGSQAERIFFISRKSEDTKGEKSSVS
ncbi:class I SAM-dependent methyltransferase [Bacillus sp. ISL-47]|uniref:class I SAM-dependent DNA methyltransferase n=1 Tax=Bacillus sp. ISL-47 TaxID=2819130 RepID=UPI001BE95072|nr:class I SAM-dependent methyltransferase [Bacillus sp. ISL-47]MBT2690295.1 class I SAM-dependent methyltransferase [Bacillus sp. ISL-47]MBT2708000.1 class I SAM-dependent methyltransferase [Pseudomonas sp. ISL-84]